MKKILFLLTTIALMATAHSIRADVLELKNGTILNGKYAGGTAGTVRFETATGAQVIETAQIVALTFTTTAGTAAASTTPAQAAPAAQAQSAVTIPAGTTLLVRTVDGVSSKTKAGTTFTTKLEADAGGLKAGTMIYGKVQSSTQARRAAGQSSLDLRLTQIVVNGKSVPISTSGFQQAGQRSGRKAAKGAAAGAAIGAAAGDAGKGAAIGATVGAVKKGETVTVPPGTLLEFTLTQPVTVPGN